MFQQLFVNLPVKNLAKSVEFFTELGFTFNPQFTDDSATCMIVNENIMVMLLVESRFKTFTSKEICDAKRQTEVINALQLESREAVAKFVEKAIAAGGTSYAEPKDHGFMIQHGFEDLDGHIWEVFWMDPAGMAQVQASSAE